MEKRIIKQNSREITGENIAMAGEDTIAAVPLIRIGDQIRVQVPAAAIPVEIHGAQHRALSREKPSVPPSFE